MPKAGLVHELRTEDHSRLLHVLTDWVISSDIELPGIEVTMSSLEDVYLRLTGSAEAA